MPEGLSEFEPGSEIEPNVDEVIADVAAHGFTDPELISDLHQKLAMSSTAIYKHPGFTIARGFDGQYTVEFESDLRAA